MEHGWRILGYVLLGLGLFSYITIRWENLGIEWRVWERGEQAGAFACGIAFLAGIFLAVLGCGGSQPEVVGPRDLATSEQIGWTIVVGLIFYVIGAISWAKKSLACRWCETVSKVGLVISVAGLVGFFLLSSAGCCARLPGPTDPVTVEVVACEPTLGQYLQLERWRQEIGVCETAMAEEGERQAIHSMAVHDVDRLGREFDIYRVQNRTDCYCGPICEEITKFIEDAEAEGCGPW